MPRIPYQPSGLAEPKQIVDAIRLRRGGELLNLDRMLLHSAAFAKGWNAFLGAVRNELELSPRLRKLTMCAVASGIRVSSPCPGVHQDRWDGDASRSIAQAQSTAVRPKLIRRGRAVRD